MTSNKSSRVARLAKLNSLLLQRTVMWKVQLEGRFLGRRGISYQIQLNSHRMVKLGGVRSQSDRVRRRKNYKDKRSYGD
ncbi:MAG: hypothetical protein F6K35_28855 [Okeania sp. SIO2H7]|nr:hypothetical protein [Okeania sp. SIO2H7]